LNPANYYAALQSHNSNYDGLFFVGVSTTRIYCRPICRERLPQTDRCTFYTSAAHAEKEGYRPCLRCRPELAPGNLRITGNEIRLAAERIRSELLIHHDAKILMDTLGLQADQFQQTIEDEYKVSTTELVTTQRLLFAKQLLTDTSLTMDIVAQTCGFATVQQLQDSFAANYRLELASLRKECLTNEENTILLRLGYRPPLAWNTLTHFLCSRSNPHLSQIQNGNYLQTVNLDGYQGWIVAKQDTKHHQIQVQVQVSSSLLPCLAKLRTRLRCLFDLDANPANIDAHLSNDKLLRLLIANHPGLRIPGTLDIFELGLRTILGQQITVKAATTIFGRFVAAFGKTIATPFSGLDRTSPPADIIADASLQALIDIGLTGRRAQTIQRFAQVISEGSLQLELINQEKIIEQLLALPGIGPWTAQYIAIRALGDSNAFPASDLGLLRGLKVKKPAELLHRTEKWQPWRAYAAVHLWCQCFEG
jgi:AraC family transcriptional regulator of adaptative response / DNA-3-methyladenine glycosylase II